MQESLPQSGLSRLKLLFKSEVESGAPPRHICLDGDAVPLLWLTMFRSQDWRSNHSGAKLNAEPKVLTVSCTLALERLRAASAFLQKQLGDRVDVDGFIALLVAEIEGMEPGEGDEVVLDLSQFRELNREGMTYLMGCFEAGRLPKSDSEIVADHLTFPGRLRSVCGLNPDASIPSPRLYLDDVTPGDGEQPAKRSQQEHNQFRHMIGAGLYGSSACQVYSSSGIPMDICPQGSMVGWEPEGAFYGVGEMPVSHGVGDSQDLDDGIPGSGHDGNGGCVLS